MAMSLIPAFLVGFASIVFQTAVTRRFLTLFSGNELDVGIVLAVWMGAVGLGSLAGLRVKRQGSFNLVFPLTAVLGHATVLAIPYARALFSIRLGEEAPLAVVIMAAVLFVAPLCFLIGMLYPIMVSRSGGKAAEVYAWEAAGACSGGLAFTLLLAGRISTPFVAFGTASLILAAGAVLSRQYRMFSFLAIPFFLLVFFDHAAMKDSISAGRLITLSESKYGEIRVYQAQSQMNVFTSGRFYFAYPDTQTEEIQTHLPLSLHTGAGRVLIIGGSPATVREALKHQVQGIDFLDLDPEMLRISLALVSAEDRAAMEDPRVRIIAMDARGFVKRHAEKGYGLIVVNLPAPLTANINRFYTTEFFSEARKIMTHDGVLVIRFPAAYGYIGKRMQVASGAVFSSMSAAFGSVSVSSAEYGICAASDIALDTSPELLSRRFRERSVKTSFFQPYLFDDAFSASKTEVTRERFQAGARLTLPNTDTRPVAYLHHLLLWAEAQRAGWLLVLLDNGKAAVVALCAVFTAGAVIVRRRRPAVYRTLWSTGFGTMGFSMALLLSYQAHYGSVYERIGLLSALFMAGMAGGAYAGKKGKNPLALLRIVGTVTALFFAGAHFLFVREGLFFLCAVAAGALAAMEFSAANRFLTKDDPAGVAGKLYAVDLAGSFPGALLAAVFLVPGLGISNTLLVMAFLKAVATVSLFTGRHEQD